MDSSGIFKEGIKKPEINFSSDISGLGHYDTGKDEIVIDLNLHGNDSNEMINTLAEEVAHAAIYKNPNKENDERIRYLKNALCVYAGYNQNSDLYDKNPNEKAVKYNATKVEEDIKSDVWKPESDFYKWWNGFLKDYRNVKKYFTK